ncbi:metallopeptidase TldD-related protein [Buchnera aphidicola]|uniref:metallopeptidase TldD-related protein n=1 Tax=Buchnera aphidicola TaxID=9 RepID=UPI0031B6AFDF
MLDFNITNNEKKILIQYLKFSLEYLKKKKMIGLVQIEKNNNFNLIIRNKILENIEYSSNISIYITAYYKHRQFSLILSHVTKKNIQCAIDRIFFIIQNMQKDLDLGLPKLKNLYNQDFKLNLFFPWSFNISKIKDLVLCVEDAALNFSKKIINSEGTIFNSLIKIKFLGNSLNWFNSQISTENYLCSNIIAADKNSMETSSEYFLGRDIKDLKDPSVIGIKSAKKSISKLGSRNIQTQISSIIFSSEVSSNLFFYLFKALNGYSVYKKTTFLLYLLNTRIFPKWLDIYENPFYDKGLSSKLFDGEGVKTICRKIVKNGKIKTWLLDTYSGKKIFQETTGHCSGIHNWFINSQIPRLSLKKLLKNMNKGILVTELMGEGVNLMTGDYSKGASGFWVENGEIKYPINKFTISGNLLKLWKNIINLGNDARKYQKISCASIFLSEIQISGV